jgi:tetratricopeptide (TPR) repeat protein
LSAQPAGPPATASDFRRYYFPLFLTGAGERPPALPLLAVRAARRALDENPDDANAYLGLAQAYRALRDETAEHSREGRLPPLAMLRHVQIVTALEHALALNPNLEFAHQNLAALYAERQYLDVALEHRRAQRALLRRGKPLPGESAEAFAHRRGQIESLVQELEGLVQERQNTFAVRSASLHDPLPRAQLALNLGLARTALDDILLKSRVLLFGTGGARLELELLLLTGRAEEVREKLDDEEMQQARQTLGYYDIPGVDPSGRLTVHHLPAYEWLLCCRAAAGGDYDRVAGVLQEMLAQMQGESRRNLPHLRLALPAALATEVAARAQPGIPLFAILPGTDREKMTEALARTLRLPAEAADLHVVAGVLDLERGLPAAARNHLKQALALCPPGSPAEPYFAGRPLALAYLEWLPAPRE